MNEQQFKTWLDLYAEAFERKEADAAARLFTSDATYQWGPFGELLHGPSEIRAKWAAAMDRSGQATCEFEILAITEPLSFARWLASYTYAAEQRRVHYDGVFAVQLTPAGLCSEFREWWNTREEALESRGHDDVSD